MDNRESNQRPIFGSKLAKAALPIALTIIIALVGYIHTATVNAFSGAIKTTTTEFQEMKLRVDAIDAEQNKRTNRLAVFERDIDNLRADFQKSVNRIEKWMDKIDTKLDRLTLKGSRQ